MQLSPSNKIYAQALKKIEDLTQRYSSLRSRSSDEIAGEVNDVLKDIRENVDGPSFKYKEIEYGSIPDSFEMNKFLQALAYDVNVAIDESDIVKAASVHTHNFIKTEILKSERENERLHNKIKTLQLYSASEDSSILYLGDYFYNDDYIDWDKVTLSERVELIHGEQISLGVVEQTSAFTADGSVKILEGSNGFIGNNQEVLDSVTEGEEIILFKQEDNRDSNAAKLNKILDNQPNTTFQFEKYEVKTLDRNIAKNFNFSYQVSGAEETEYLNNFAGDNGEVDWADGLAGGELKLNLSIDLGSVSPVNIISFNPYGLTDNINGPILIKSVRVSEDQSDWSTLKEKDIWLANGIDQNSVNLDSENIKIGNATFRVDGLKVRYIRVEVTQPHAINSLIGHIYYTSRDDELDDQGELERFAGPIPSVDATWREKDSRASYRNQLVQRREAFNGKRWAIGIRDISAFSTRYSQTSKMVSNKFFVPGGVDRVSIEANLEIPASYETTTAWVRFFISPDDGNTWHQISRIQDDFFGVPEVIAYNDNTPVDLRIPGVAYYETAETPTSIRVKIEMDRYFDEDTLTPHVKDYKVKVKQRNSL